jgi:hypothetical protein
MAPRLLRKNSLNPARPTWRVAAAKAGNTGDVDREGKAGGIMEGKIMAPPVIAEEFPESGPADVAPAVLPAEARDGESPFRRGLRRKAPPRGRRPPSPP